MPNAPLRSRDDYKHFAPIQTRWMDNDVYAHVNNVVYYSYFDTVVNAYLVNEGALNVEKSEVIGLVVETGCDYFAPAAFPDALEGALRVARIGTSSVRYELGIFRQGETTPIAEGHFIHVYVARDTRRPIALPGAFRRALGKIAIEKRESK